ncbi:MAG: 50S ribosomal protein L30 [Anaerolineaceae bacterium]|nr:50S ribosomal protein L30 [Anaerolineaceae bacterium]
MPKKKEEAAPKMLRITLVKSAIGYTERHKATVRALGLRRLHQTVEQVDSPVLRGMLRKVNHLVKIEEQG